MAPHRRGSIHAIKSGTEGIDRMGSAQKKKIKMKVIQCYAPTNDSDEETKDRFYSRLQSILDKYRKKDVIILMGDFNAKIGTDNNGYEEAMGSQGVGEMNENRERSPTHVH